MTDEEKRQRYKNIVYRLRVINSKIEDLENSISGLKETTKKSICINDQPYSESEINESTEKLKSAISSIKGNIIPSLNRKIYE